jgi:hypothetical protein
MTIEPDAARAVADFHTWFNLTALLFLPRPGLFAGCWSTRCRHRAAVADPSLREMLCAASDALDRGDQGWRLSGCGEVSPSRSRGRPTSASMLERLDGSPGTAPVVSMTEDPPPPPACLRRKRRSAIPKRARHRSAFGPYPRRSDRKPQDRRDASRRVARSEAYQRASDRCGGSGAGPAWRIAAKSAVARRGSA